MPIKDPEKRKQYHREYFKEYYQRNRKKYIDKKQLRKKRNQKFINGIKKDSGCVKCGEKHPACLVFHHRKPREKEYDISVAADRGWSYTRIEKEIEKCDVLCSNCHLKLHHKKRRR